MAKSKYAAGLRFVVSTPTKTLDKHDRKAIHSHSTKAGGLRRQVTELRSWITPNRALEPTRESSFLSGPQRVGSDFSGLQLPPGFEPHMIQDLAKLIDLNNHGVYPYEICLNVHPVERVRAFVDGFSDNRLSRLASFHYAQTLQLLRARLDEIDHTSAISDSTMMVVITLATAAELTGDFEAVANHIKGLEKMVALRGGVRTLTANNNMQVKVCRADLSYALLFGHPPRLFKEISWDCFIADHGMSQCNHKSNDSETQVFMETLDKRLCNVLRDLHAFSCISNLAYQTTRKLSPELYNEMVISILYRLTRLSFEIDLVQEALRTGLLAFASTIFLQRQFKSQPSHHLTNLFNNALFQILHTKTLPVPVLLWLTTMSHLIAENGAPQEDWRSVALDQAIFRAGTGSWIQARELLFSVAWVDFVHNDFGKRAFELSISRQRTLEIDVTNDAGGLEMLEPGL